MVPAKEQLTGIRVFLDDERDTPEGWVRTYWPEDVIDLLKSENVLELSLDHDLGDDEHGTGYDVLLWIEEQVFMNDFVPPTIRVHSANSSARIKMLAAIGSIERGRQDNEHVAHALRQSPGDSQCPGFGD